MKKCFVCQSSLVEVKPIGLKELKCKEVYLCNSCDNEIKEMRQIPNIWLIVNNEPVNEREK